MGGEELSFRLGWYLDHKVTYVFVLILADLKLIVEVRCQVCVRTLDDS